MHHPQAPIGIYDSGLGGLSVVKQVMQILPQESLLYVADTARVPYGGRSPEEIRSFSYEILDFLVEQGVKMVAVACNTSSVLILPTSKKHRHVPVYSLAQAGAHLPAKTKRVALLATEATVRSGQYKRLLQLHHPLVELFEVACPDFVPLVENGHWDSDAAFTIVAQRLLPLRECALDAVILGCSHFPYLHKAIRAALGPQVKLLDPAERLAQQLASELQHNCLLNRDPKPIFHVYTTACPSRFQPLAERFLQIELRYLRQTCLGGRLTSFDPTSKVREKNETVKNAKGVGVR